MKSASRRVFLQFHALLLCWCEKNQTKTIIIQPPAHVADLHLSTFGSRNKFLPRSVPLIRSLAPLARDTISQSAVNVFIYLINVPIIISKDCISRQWPKIQLPETEPSRRVCACVWTMPHGRSQFTTQTSTECRRRKESTSAVTALVRCWMCWSTV